MDIIKTSIDGCFEIQPRVFEDKRGKLVKIFHHKMFEDIGLRTDFKEMYYSVSKKHVLRGLHFQLPPHDHVKCVTCLSGKIFDVVVDLRKNSPTFKKNFTLELDSNKGNMLYIPKGLAHGFLALSKETIFLNQTTTVYNSESDIGVHWNSCGINWPKSDFKLSDKDENMQNLDDFLINNPF